jgi:hypothetical protein
MTRMDVQRAPSAFVVWLARDAEGRLGGTVERVRTSDRRRFSDLTALAGLLESMAPPAEGEP